MSKETYLDQLNSGQVKSEEQRIKEAEEDLDFHMDQKILLEREIEAQEETFKVIHEHPKPLELTYEYQKQDAYWEWQKTLREIQFKKQIDSMYNSLSRLNNAIEMKNEELLRMKGEQDE